MTAPVFSPAGPDAELIRSELGSVAFIERQNGDFDHAAVIAWRIGSEGSEPIVGGVHRPIAAVQFPNVTIQSPTHLHRSKEEWLRTIG